MVLIRRQMKARQNSEGHRLPTWLCEFFSGERHKDPCRIKQTFECLVLKTVNSIHVDWIYAARQGSQCCLHLWISTTCSLPEPWGHWHPWNPCQPLLECPDTLPMVQEPILAQLSPFTSWYSGLASDATAASGHVQAALVPAGMGSGCRDPAWLPCSLWVPSVPGNSQPSPNTETSTRYEAVEHQPNQAEMQSWVGAGYQSDTEEIPRIGLGGAGTPGKSAGREDALSLLFFYGHRNLCFGKKISNHTEFKWNFISQLQNV